MPLASHNHAQAKKIMLLRTTINSKEKTHTSFFEFPSYRYFMTKTSGLVIKTYPPIVITYYKDVSGERARTVFAGR
jgi:hypothetical protein